MELTPVQLKRFREQVLGIEAIEVEIGRQLIETENLDLLAQGAIDQVFVIAVNAQIGDALTVQVVDTGVASLDADLKAAQRRGRFDAADRDMAVDGDR